MENAINKILVYIFSIALLIGCTGEDGVVGPSGLNSLVLTSEELAGSNCEHGGLKIETGLDNNSNGELETDEVLKTDYVCSVAGNNSLINIEDEPVGVICANGGIKIESGVDVDADGTLDTDEIQITRYICHGVDGGFDEQIRIQLKGLEVQASSTASTEYQEIGISIIDFKKSSYTGVDSIVFVTSPYSTGGNTAFLELYDYTNNLSINMSEVSSNADGYDNRVFVKSKNIFDELSDDYVDLGMRIKSGTDGVFAARGVSYLFLYRTTNN